ncbi:hypothetical protein AVEN_198134-1 [Araneus ventricosus]|uniref:Uncharacterized protein n=1 Tax=Araneus ventricosus TaxID=182803 RepID=A0A4Y2JG87_ARAVE|nr:hypothetical protein AVEN_198134-1 [Araneus ventricosus]
MRRIGNLHFTYEEFETVMIQTEEILKSLPLTPLSSDEDNFDALTPGHFLIGRPIISLPEPFLTDINEIRLSRWQEATKVVPGSVHKRDAQKVFPRITSYCDRNRNFPLFHAVLT